MADTGGGIYNAYGALTVDNSIFRGNSASTSSNNYAGGGGIFNGNYGSRSIVHNSTFSGNRAGYSGGGIYSLNLGASVNVQNSTIVYNQSMAGYGIGGGIGQQDGAYNITNTIIANNTAPAGNPDCSATLASASYNIIGNMTGCTITSGSSNLNVDPQIDPNLTEVMQVHKLLTGSPAIMASSTARGSPSR